MRRPTGPTGPSRSAEQLRLCAWYLLLVFVSLSTTTAVPTELVPNLCKLIDQPLFCRCDAEDITEDATDVTCYVLRDVTEDHVVFKAFQKHPSVVSIEFNTFGQDHKLHFVPSEALQHTPLLERLKFVQADLGILKSHSFFNLSKLAALSLDSNEIADMEKESIAYLPRLKKLELADNKLKKLRARAISHLPALTHMFLERNQIDTIEDLAFAGLGNVKELDLSDNIIERLNEKTFRGLNRVIRLDMFRNKLQRLDARVFSGMPMLVELDLKYNQISEVDPLAFDGVPHLTILYLSFNHLRVLPAHMFMGAPNLVTIDLSQNELLTLTWRTVQDLRKIGAESFDMSLTGNKFGCDCRLAWMLHLENATRNEKFRRELRHIKCNLDGSGNVNSSSKVTRLTPTQLGCPKDYTTPELTSTTTSMGRKTTWASSGSHVGVGRPENANRIEEDVVELPSKDMEAPVEREKTMKNEIEVVLNQQKNVEKVSAPSRKHSGNSASVLWKSLGHQVFCLAVALALVVAR